jgi:hypothetical protein
MSLDDYPNMSKLKWKQPTEIMGAQRITKNKKKIVRNES